MFPIQLLAIEPFAIIADEPTIEIPEGEEPEPEPEPETAVWYNEIADHPIFRILLIIIVVDNILRWIK